MKLHTYLNYGGNCAEAFRFYEQHLGAKIDTMMKFSDMPDPAKAPRQEAALATKHPAAAVLNATTANASQPATAPKRGRPSQTASNAAAVAPSAAEKRKPSAAQLRHLARQERNKHFAYQQDSDFEARFLGHAD